MSFCWGRFLSTAVASAAAAVRSAVCGGVGPSLEVGRVEPAGRRSVGYVEDPGVSRTRVGKGSLDRAGKRQERRRGRGRPTARSAA